MAGSIVRNLSLRAILFQQRKRDPGSFDERSHHRRRSQARSHTEPQVRCVDKSCRFSTSVNGSRSRSRRMNFGYARVSTADQNPDHRIDALLRAGVDGASIHLDTASGAKASRPKLDLVLQLLREGDTLKVTRLDRLSRSVLHLVTLGADAEDRPACDRAGHRHRHDRGPGDVRDAVGAGRAAARADRGEHDGRPSLSTGPRPGRRPPASRIQTSCVVVAGGRRILVRLAHPASMRCASRADVIHVSRLASRYARRVSTSPG
jgi:hypothetical protein